MAAIGAQSQGEARRFHFRGWAGRTPEKTRGVPALAPGVENLFAFGYSATRTGMSGFDRVVCQVRACRGARSLVKTGNQEMRTLLLLTLPKSLTSR